MIISTTTDFNRGVRPCIVALRLDADDGNTYWDYLNIKYPQSPLCFSIFEADAKDAITISQGLAFLHFGCTSNRDGSISCHTFQEPKEISFVINFSNSKILHELAVSLPCPRSGSLLQNWLIDDKSIQRMILSPDVLLRLFVSKETHETGGFKYELLTSLNKSNSLGKIEVIDFKMIMLHLQKFVTDYFDLHPMENKIVVKNASWEMFSCDGVLILDRSNVAELQTKLERLHITPTDNVLVECFIDNRLSAERPYHRIRVYSTCNGKISSKMKESHKVNIPTSLSPFFFTFSDTPYCTGDTSMLHVDTITSRDLRCQIHAITQKYWDTILPCLMEVDKDAELVLFGFDFVLSPKGPVCLEVNNLDSLSAYSLYVHETHGDECGLKPLYGMYNHMLSRSYDYMLRGRTVVVVGVGCYSKLHLFDYLARVEAHVVLLDVKPPPASVGGAVKHYIKVSLYDPAQYEVEAKKVTAKLKELELEPFSVMTLYEDYVPFRTMLTDILQEEGILKLKNKTLSFATSLRNKDKVRVYNAIRGQPSSYFDARQFSIASSAIVLTDKNLSTIQIGCPHILKLSTSSSAYGCMRINSTKDIVPAYQAAKKLIASTPTDAGVGMCFSTQIFMSEMYDGSEHDLDIIMRDGEPIWHIFSDNIAVAAGGSTDGTQFLEKGCVMPSTIITGVESKQILSRITQALKYLSLTHGVFNVEFILTAFGVKIIDVNPRPGGYYINEWVNAITGVCTYAAEVILQSELEYFVQPLVSGRSIVGYNVFSRNQLTKETGCCPTDVGKDVRVFYVQNPDEEVDSTELYATIYEITDLFH